MQACLIVNPIAGNGAAERAMARIQPLLAGRAEIQHTRGRGHATEIASRAACSGFAPVIAVGGDGTVMEVVQGLLQRHDPPPLGIVPLGNGNDLARTLRIPRDPAEAVRRIWSAGVARIDVGRCNDCYFLNVGGVGVDTQVAAAMGTSPHRLLRNPAGYLLYGLRELWRFENPEFEIHLDDEVIMTRSLLVAIANGRYFAGGMKICPEATPTDGLFDVCIAGDLSRRETLTLMPLIYAGRHVTHPKVQMRRSSSVRIARPEGSAVQLDGEVIETLPAEFRVMPQALPLVGAGNVEGCD